ncbi:MAG: NAD(P)/FAD-dependent oxidoreductase [Solirubrobacterales bacterium]
MNRERVLIVGGGVASIEAALALRDICGERVEIDVFSPRRDFIYRPYAVGEPFGTAHVVRYDLSDLLALCDATFHLESVTAVDAERRFLITRGGERYPYDYLILAQGARSIWPVPGAVTFWGIADDRDVARVVDRLRDSDVKRVVFTAPSLEGWTLPLYELALLSEHELAIAGIDEVKLAIATPEDAPLQVFGRSVSEQMSDLLKARGVELLCGAHPVRFENGALQVIPREEIRADVAVSLPKLEGRRIRGVLHDPAGFIRIDDRCRVLKRDRLFAAGDVTNFPVKQGGVATQQADVVAEAIAAELGICPDPAPLDPVLRGVLWTGGKPLYLKGWPGGGHGEASSLTEEPPWGETEGKIVGKYLSPFIAEINNPSAMQSAWQRG